MPRRRQIACGVDADAHEPAHGVVENGEIHGTHERLDTLCGVEKAMLAQSVFHRKQAGEKVSAIDGGDVLRGQRTQGAGVVPVVKMTAVLRHTLKRSEHIHDKLDAPTAVDAEVGCAQSGA